jgi:RNA polymerase sigma factor (sigma-70 family)
MPSTLALAAVNSSSVSARRQPGRVLWLHAFRGRPHPACSDDLSVCQPFGGLGALNGSVAPAESSFENRFPDLLALSVRTSYSIVRDRQEAEDVAIETLARAAQRWSRVEPHASAWVVRVATNLSFDSLRRSRRRRWSEPNPKVDDDVDQRLDLVIALRALPRRQREVLVLQHCCGFTAQETADLLGVTPGAVKQHGSRGRRSMRSVLRDGDRSPDEQGEYDGSG